MRAWLFLRHADLTRLLFPTYCFDFCHEIRMNVNLGSPALVSVRAKRGRCHRRGMHSGRQIPQLGN